MMNLDIFAPGRALVDRFRVGEASATAPAARAPAPRPAQARAATTVRPGRTGGAALATKVEDWEEF